MPRTVRRGNKRIYKHRLITGLEFVDGDTVVHHKDRNDNNNVLTNLEVLGRSEHSSLHAKQQGFGLKVRYNQPVQIDAEGMLICKECSARKHFTEFVPKIATASGLTHLCRKCNSKHTKERRALEKRTDLEGMLLYLINT
jgi:superfamily II helicase